YCNGRFFLGADILHVEIVAADEGGIFAVGALGFQLAAAFDAALAFLLERRWSPSPRSTGERGEMRVEDVEVGAGVWQRGAGDGVDLVQHAVFHLQEKVAVVHPNDG